MPPHNMAKESRVIKRFLIVTILLAVYAAAVAVTRGSELFLILHILLAVCAVVFAAAWSGRRKRGGHPRNADPEYGPFQFTIADLLGLMGIVAVLGSLGTLPVSLYHAIPLFAVLYVVKYRTLTLRVQPWLGLPLYFLVVAALLPYLYYRIIDVSDCSGCDPLANWIGGPVLRLYGPNGLFLVRHARPQATILEVLCDKVIGRNRGSCTLMGFGLGSDYALRLRVDCDIERRCLSPSIKSCRGAAPSMNTSPCSA